VDRDVVQAKNTAFGDKYELKCELRTPDKRNPCIVTVWIVEKGQEAPKLITAYPAG
jgi:filamentous hemagglutinin